MEGKKCDKANLMIDKELKGLVHFVVNILGLHLLEDELGDDGVDPKVELLDRLLPVFSTRLRSLEPLHQHLDLLLVLLLPLLRLLLGHLEGLQVLANHAKLFLQVDYLKGGDTGFT